MGSVVIINPNRSVRNKSDPGGGADFNECGRRTRRRRSKSTCRGTITAGGLG
jgi:hypothetical protein